MSRAKLKAIFWLIVITTTPSLGIYGLVKVTKYYTCQGQCAHGDKHCQQMCLDRGYCPRERE